MGENICQHEILLSTDKIKYIKIDGVSPYPTFIRQNYPAYASDGSEWCQRKSLHCRKKRGGGGCQSVASPKAWIRAKAETCGKGMCDLVASIVVKCSLDYIFYKKT